MDQGLLQFIALNITYLIVVEKVFDGTTLTQTSGRAAREVLFLQQINDKSKSHYKNMLYGTSIVVYKCLRLDLDLDFGGWKWRVNYEAREG